MPSNDAKVKVVLTNTTNAPLTVTGKLAKKPNNIGSPQTFGLAAHQTKVLDLREDFTDGNQFANAEIIALSLQHSGVKDALLARVMVAEVQRGYSNVVRFSNPSGGSSSEHQGVGFQIEDIANQSPMLVWIWLFFLKILVSRAGLEPATRRLHTTLTFASRRRFRRCSLDYLITHSKICLGVRRIVSEGFLE
jgi:hypothetical protein